MTERQKTAQRCTELSQPGRAAFSSASRACGVSRWSARLWAGSARCCTLLGLARAARNKPNATSIVLSQTPAKSRRCPKRSCCTLRVLAIATTQQPGSLQVASPPATGNATAQQHSGPASGSELFCFSAPADLANEVEALHERAAILAVENGWDAASSLLKTSLMLRRIELEPQDIGQQSTIPTYVVGHRETI
jgi:hypothetical protein